MNRFATKGVTLFMVVFSTGTFAADDCDEVLREKLMNSSNVIDSRARVAAQQAAACAYDRRSSQSSVGGTAFGYGDVSGAQSSSRDSGSCNDFSSTEYENQFHAQATRALASDVVKSWSQCKIAKTDGLFCYVTVSEQPTLARLRIVWREAGSAKVAESHVAGSHVAGRADNRLLSQGENLLYGERELLLERSEAEAKRESIIVLNVEQNSKSLSCGSAWPRHVEVADKPVVHTPSATERACETLRTNIKRAVNELTGKLSSTALRCFITDGALCAGPITDQDRSVYRNVQSFIVMQWPENLSDSDRGKEYGNCNISESSEKVRINLCSGESLGFCPSGSRPSNPPGLPPLPPRRTPAIPGMQLTGPSGMF